MRQAIIIMNMSAAFLRGCHDTYFIHENKSFIIWILAEDWMSIYFLPGDGQSKKKSEELFNYSMACKNPKPKYK